VCRQVRKAGNVRYLLGFFEPLLAKNAAEVDEGEEDA
jgi:hypothetical protein